MFHRQGIYSWVNCIVRHTNYLHARKQITTLSKDKAKLEEELSDVQISLSREKSQYAALNRAFLKTTEELTQAQVHNNNKMG